MYIFDWLLSLSLAWSRTISVTALYHSFLLQGNIPWYSPVPLRISVSLLYSWWWLQDISNRNSVHVSYLCTYELYPWLLLLELWWIFKSSWSSVGVHWMLKCARVFARKCSSYEGQTVQTSLQSVNNKSYPWVTLIPSTFNWLTLSMRKCVTVSWPCFMNFWLYHVV